MTSKAKKARKARVTLAGGQQIPQRATGRDRRHTNQPEDATKTAAQARTRHSGIADPKDAIQPLRGTDMGLCIDALTKGDECKALENTWQAISASRYNYLRLYVGQTGNPQGSAIAMLPEPMQADVSLRVDLRTAEEKVAAAKASWGGWDAKIKALPTPLHIWALKGALDGFLGEATLWRDQAPTDKGRVAVDALRKVGE